jgi:hypothetical protein
MPNGNHLAVASRNDPEGKSLDHAMANAARRARLANCEPSEILSCILPRDLADARDEIHIGSLRSPIGSHLGNRTMLSRVRESASSPTSTTRSSPPDGRGFGSIAATPMTDDCKKSSRADWLDPFFSLELRQGSEKNEYHG